MTIVERLTNVFEDEKRTKSVVVKSWEISGVPLPREKNVPLALRLSGCPAVFLSCSHQNADVFLAFPISFYAYWKLKWHRLWH